MFVWAKIPEPWSSQMTSFEFAMRLLKEADVVVSPGGGFGPAGEGYLRMALVENENRLRQAVRQIGRFMAGKPVSAYGANGANNGIDATAGGEISWLPWRPGSDLNYVSTTYGKSITILRS